MTRNPVKSDYYGSSVGPHFKVVKSGRIYPTLNAAREAAGFNHPVVEVDGVTHQVIHPVRVYLSIAVFNERKKRNAGIQGSE